MAQVKVTIFIKNDQVPVTQIQVELDSTTTIQEIFDFIKDAQKLNGNINQWTCYSQSKGQYLVDVQQTLGNLLREDTLTINIADNARLALTNTSRGLAQNGSQANQGFLNQQQPQQFAQQPPLPQNQFIQQQQSAPQNEKISLSINITDGNNKRTFRSAFNPQDTLNDVSIATQNYCGVSQDVAAIDLFIFNQPYNQDVKRKQTLQQLQLKDNTTIEAKVRWYGGNI